MSSLLGSTIITSLTPALARPAEELVRRGVPEEEREGFPFGEVGLRPHVRELVHSILTLFPRCRHNTCCGRELSWTGRQLWAPLVYRARPGPWRQHNLCKGHRCHICGPLRDAEPPDEPDTCDNAYRRQTTGLVTFGGKTPVNSPVLPMLLDMGFTVFNRGGLENFGRLQLLSLLC